MKIGVLEKYNTPLEHVGAFMQLLLAYQFYSLWTSPSAVDADKIADFAAIMGFEFVMVHSGVFMAVMPKKVSLYFLIPVYGIFALTMNSFVSDNSILIIYGLVVFNRMRFAFSDVGEVIKAKVVLNSVIAVLVYFVLLFIVATGSEYIPVFGLTKEFLSNIDYYNNIKIGGLFLEEPQTALALGFLYYIVIAFASILTASKQKRVRKN